MTTTIMAPFSGQLIPLEAVPDAVFARQLVGPGLALMPEDTEKIVVKSPISGMISKLQPHAFVVVSENGLSVLVHLGIDTVALSGAGYKAQVSEGAQVAQGQPVIVWEVAKAVDAGCSPISPIIVMGADAGDLITLASEHAESGEPILQLN